MPRSRSKTRIKSQSRRGKAARRGKATSKGAGTRPSRTPSAHRAAHHVLVHSPDTARLAAAAPALGSYTQRGSTTHFNVFYDNTLGTTGAALGDGVLAACETDYQKLKSIFGGLTPPGLPFNIYIDPGYFGAYHSTCADVNLHCAAESGNSTDAVNFLVVAEEVEVFSAAQGLGWNCGASNGEGLSRVLATAFYPAQLDGFATACVWMDGNRPDWVNANENTDRDGVANGCSVLFLNYLHYQLGYSWQQIVAAAASTLAGTYFNLTGATNGYFNFVFTLDLQYPPGTPCTLVGDNPFPILFAGPIINHYEIWNWLIGSLADGPLWVLGPHGPEPIPPGPGPIDIREKAQLAHAELRQVIDRLRQLGGELDRAQHRSGSFQ